MDDEEQTILARQALGDVRFLLGEFDPPAIPVSPVFRANRTRSPAVRALVEAAREHFAA